MPRSGRWIAMALALAMLSAPRAEDWNQWRGAGRDGAVDDSPALIETLPPAGLQPLWTSESIKWGGDGGWGSPVVADGRVYLFSHEHEKVRDLDPPAFPPLTEERKAEMSEEEVQEYETQRGAEEKERRQLQFQYREFLHCFDAETGETIWTNQSDSLYTQFPQSGSPTVVDGRVYILGAGRRVRCVEAGSGDDAWEQTLPGEFDGEMYQSSIAVLDGVAFVTADRLFGIDAATGEIRWQSPEGVKGAVHSSPAIWSSTAGQRVICHLDGGWTGCFDPQDGRELWRLQTNASVSTPLVSGDRLITYGHNRKAGLRCYQLTDEGAEELWTFHGAQDKGSSPVIVDGHVYVQGEARIACVNLDNGEETWRDVLNLRDPQYTSLVAADGKLFYAYEALVCVAADPAEFKVLYDARFAKSGAMATEEQFLQQLAAGTEGTGSANAEDRERLLSEHLGNPPRGCTSPAIGDGRIYLRLHNALACYDLRKATNVAGNECR